MSAMTNVKKTLQFRVERSTSIAPKVTIISWYLVCTAAAAYMTLSNEGGPTAIPARQAALFACVLIFVARAAITLFAFVKRRIPWWEAAWGGSLIGIVLFVFLRNGLRAPDSMDGVDLVGALLYLAGSYAGTASEYARHRWKAGPGNQGRLYTGGLFRYSRHINYFGDLLLFLGLGMLTRQVWTVFVPLGMGLNFALVIIPAHDAYLAMRYGVEFDEYARRTKKLVPFVY